MAIIRSLLDLDQYKPTMAQVVWRRFGDIPVTYSFKNRTAGTNLADYIIQEELEEELNLIRSLRFSVQDRWYLRHSWQINQIKPGLFSRDFIASLEGLELPPVEVHKENGTYAIEVSGLWPRAIWWETMVLAVLNELYCRSALQRTGVWTPTAWKEGERRLLEKVALLKANPDITFVEFGTRRRFSAEWQRRVLEVLLEEIPNQVLGTSNVALAREFNIKPIGTFAHEMFMVLYGHACAGNKKNPVLTAHRAVCEAWWKEYGETLSISLTDTFGTDFFLENFTAAQAHVWRGLRQDSGDPIEIGEKIIAFYEKHKIDPREKLILFSDGLSIEKIIELTNHFKGRIKIAFGWGTNLTNDVGLAPLSLVMKATEASGHGTLKLSDNPAKATGTPEDIERVMQEVGYKKRPAQPVVY